MPESNDRTVNEVADTIRTLWFDLPLAAYRWSLGLSSEDEFSAIAWKGYDAGIKLATGFLVSFVKSPAINELIADVSSANYRTQSLIDQVSGRSAQRKISSLQGQINSLSEEIEELRNEAFTTRRFERRSPSVGSRRAQRDTVNPVPKPQLAVA